MLNIPSYTLNVTPNVHPLKHPHKFHLSIWKMVHMLQIRVLCTKPPNARCSQSGAQIYMNETLENSTDNDPTRTRFSSNVV
jgi:hypothetical protein